MSAAADICRHRTFRQCVCARLHVYSRPPAPSPLKSGLEFVEVLVRISKLARRASEGFVLIERPALACASG